MTGTQKTILTLAGTLVFAAFVFFGFTPLGRATWNGYLHQVEKACVNASYEAGKQVEDTARAMMASYDADKTIYDQFKDSSNTEKQGWAEQAKMRANRTATSYNDYVLKNSYFWQGNVPPDIRMRLEIIK